MSDIKLKPCPFCGCSVEIRKDKYPNGDERIEPYGWHDSGCPLDNVLWTFYVEDGCSEDLIAKAWNRRVQP